MLGNHLSGSVHKVCRNFSRLPPKPRVLSRIERRNPRSQFGHPVKFSYEGTITHAGGRRSQCSASGHQFEKGLSWWRILRCVSSPVDETRRPRFRPRVDGFLEHAEVGHPAFLLAIGRRRLALIHGGLTLLLPRNPSDNI